MKCWCDSQVDIKLYMFSYSTASKQACVRVSLNLGVGPLQILLYCSPEARQWKKKERKKTYTAVLKQGEVWFREYDSLLTITDVSVLISRHFRFRPWLFHTLAEWSKCCCRGDIRDRITVWSLRTQSGFSRRDHRYFISLSTDNCAGWTTRTVNQRDEKRFQSPYVNT